MNELKIQRLDKWWEDNEAVETPMLRADDPALAETKRKAEALDALAKMLKEREYRPHSCDAYFNPYLSNAVGAYVVCGKVAPDLLTAIEQAMSPPVAGKGEK